MIRVKVNSKSQLVEDREKKSALYRVICCFEDRLWSRAVIFFFILPYLSSIYEKASCIAILWTGRPHSLGSCHF